MFTFLGDTLYAHKAHVSRILRNSELAQPSDDHIMQKGKYRAREEKATRQPPNQRVVSL